MRTFMKQSSYLAMPGYQQLTAKTEYTQKSSCALSTKGLLYAFLGASSVVLCGVTATLWAWIRYGRHGRYSPMVIGPVLLSIGLLSIVTIGCIAWKRRKQLRNRQPLVYQVELADWN